MRLTIWSGFTHCAELTQNNDEVMPMNNNFSCSTSLLDSFKELISACTELKTNISTHSFNLFNEIGKNESLVSNLPYYKVICSV